MQLESVLAFQKLKKKSLFEVTVSPEVINKPDFEQLPR